MDSLPSPALEELHETGLVKNEAGREDPASSRKSSVEIADLYLRYWRPKAEAVFVAMGVAWDDREDVANDCFLSFLGRRETVVDPERYYMQAVRRRCVDRLRNRSRWRMVGFDSVAEVGEVDASACATIDCDRFLRELESGERRIIVEHVVEGLTHEELSAKYGILPESSRRKVHRALQSLRRVAFKVFRLPPRDPG